MKRIYELEEGAIFNFQGQTYKILYFYLDEVWNDVADDWGLEPRVEALNLLTGARCSFSDATEVIPCA